MALARRPSALADDCARAGILILTMPRPGACAAQGPVIDIYDLRDKGTHTIRFDGQRIAITTVAEIRGSRPWTSSPRLRLAENRLAAVAARGSRLGQFAPPFVLGDDGTTLRPEIEDDDDGGRR